jgi:hypothetical protein
MSEFYPAIQYPPRHRGHQSVVINPVEELFQVKIDHPLASLTHILLRFGNRLMS